jgi:hypothetical protein
LPAPKRAVKAAPLFIVGGLGVGHLHGAAGVVHRHEGVDRAVARDPLTRHLVLHGNIAPHLHAAAEGAAHMAADGDEVAELDGPVEAHVVHGHGDHGALAVPVRADGAADVEPLQQAPAEEVAERVGVVGEHHVRGLRVAI